MPILVSACLAGVKCRYNGKASPCDFVIKLVKQGKAMPVCPEQLAGFPSQRRPAELRGNRIITDNGMDVTTKYMKGSEEALRLAELARCRIAILKSKSPTCGCGVVYDGTFTGRLVKGDGVFAGMLKKKKILVLSEKQIALFKSILSDEKTKTL